MWLAPFFCCWSERGKPGPRGADRNRWLPSSRCLGVFPLRNRPWIWDDASGGLAGMSVIKASVAAGSTSDIAST